MKVLDLSGIKVKEKNQPVHLDTELSVKESGKTRKEVLEVLYHNLPSIIDIRHDSVLDSSKYVRLARDYNYRHYKLLMYSDVVRLGLDSSLNYYYKQHLKSDGAVVAIFNTLNDKPISVVFRSIQEKSFVDYSLFYALYGLDLMEKDFKYGNTLVITEGLYDADSLRPLYKNVIATLTSNITSVQANILKTMTDRFVVAFDNDEAGENGFEKALRVLGTDIKKLPIFKSDKDIGVMEEVKSSKFDYEERVQHYRQELDFCIHNNDVGFML